MAKIKEEPHNWNINESVYAIKPDPNVIDSDYLGYVLSSYAFKSQYTGKITGSVVKSLPISVLKREKIPVPPLAIQYEIVRILNSFEELRMKLESELILRKKQYDYYKHELLTLPDSIG